MKRLAILLLVLTISSCTPDDCVKEVMGFKVTASKITSSKIAWSSAFDETKPNSAENPFVTNPINVPVGGWWANRSLLLGDETLDTITFPYYAGVYREILQDITIDGNMFLMNTILLVRGNVIGSGTITTDFGYLRVTGSIDAAITKNGDIVDNYNPLLTEVLHRSGCDTTDVSSLNIWDFELPEHLRHCDTAVTLGDNSPTEGSGEILIVPCDVETPGFIVFGGKTYRIVETNLKNIL